MSFMRWIRSSCLTLVLTLLPSLQAQDTWVWRNPLPQGNDLQAVAYGNSRYVAVGLAGAVVTSGDGVTWTNQANATTNHLYGITFGAGQFVAVGEAGAILTSTNGVVWTRRASNVSSHLRGVTYSGSVFVAVGQGGKIVASSTAITWNVRASGTSVDLYGVSFGTGQGFVAVGDGGVVASSANGSSWTATTAGNSYYLTGTAWDGSKFIAVGWDSVGRTGLILTYESSRWIKQTCPTANWLNTVTYNPGMAETVAVGAGGTAISSANGWDWSLQSPGVTNNLFGVDAASGTFAAVGGAGVLQTWSGFSWASWQTRSSGPLSGCRALAYDGTNFVAVGQGGRVLSSKFTVTWTSRNSGASNDLAGVATGGGQFVAVGSAGRVVTSLDGRSWASQASGVSNDLAAVAFGGDTFVAAGSAGRILTSTNGVSWTNRASGVASPLTAVACGGGKFVAVSDDGEILTSSDTINWTNQVSGSFGLSGVAYGQGLFVVVDIWGSVQTSSNGLAWNTPIPVSADELRAVAFSGTNFVAVGLHGTLFTSPDGSIWTAKTSGLAGDLKAVTSGYGQVVLAGDNGAILAGGNTDQPIDPPEFTSPAIAYGTATTSFSYQTTALNNPTNYSAAGLPSGLSINSATGLISGTNAAAGTNVVTLSAANAGGVSTLNLTLSVAFATQTITFNSLPGHYLCDAPFTISATASSGLPVTFSVVSGPATIASNQVTLTGTGTVTVRASQAGNAAYAPAASVDRSFNVTLRPQTISFSLPSSRNLCDPPVALSATASSGLPVSFSVLSGPARIETSQVVVTNTGTVTIRASQSGDACYAAAYVDRSFTVSKQPQTITFATFTNRFVCDPPLNLSATASSSLAVSFSVVSGPAYIFGSQAIVTNTGTVTLRASQAGDACFAAAPNVDRSLSVSRWSQTITFNPPTYWRLRTPLVLPPTNSSGLPVSYSVQSGSATVVGNLCLPLAEGTLVLSATQAGNTCYDPALAQNRSLTVVGTNFTQIPLPGATGNERLQGLNFVNGCFVASGENTPYESEPVTSLILTSTDGLSWNRTTVPGGGTIHGVAYGNGRYVAVPCADVGPPYYIYNWVLTSTDLNSWAISPLPFTACRCHDIVFGNGLFVMAGEADQGAGSVFGYAHSADGLAWQSAGEMYGDNGPLAYGGGKFVSIYNYEDYYGSSRKTYPKYSSDGTNWLAVIGFDGNLDGLAYGNGVFVGVGELTFTSSDAYSWTPHASYINGLDAVAFGAGKFLAFGADVVTSTNGQQWASLQAFGWPAGGYGPFKATYGNNTFLASNDRTLYASYQPQGGLPSMPVITSAANASGTVGINFSYQITAGNSPTHFAAAGLPVGLSVNQTNGSISGTPGTDGTYAVTIAAANAGGIGTSVLTLTINPWIPCPTVQSQPQSQNVFVGATASLAVTVVGDPPLIYQWRKDGTNLANGGRISGATSNVLTVASVQTNDAAAYSVLVTNTCGTTTSSNAVLTVSVPPPQFVTSSVSISNGEFRVLLQGEAGCSFQIEISTNLTFWTNLTTLTNVTGQVPFADAITNHPRRFYRAKLLP